MVEQSWRYAKRLPERISPRRVLFNLVLIGLCASALTASRPPTALEAVLAEGELTALSRNGPTTYYETSEGTTGFEYVLLQGFADELGVTLAIKDEPSLARMLDKVTTEAGDLAAAGLTITPERQKKVRFTQPYLKVTQKLLYHRGDPKPESVADLADGELLVIAGSSHEERLQELKNEHPALTWNREDDLEMIDLVEKVHKGEVDYAIVDSNAYEINAQTFPRARVAFEIGEPEALAWAFPERADTSLYERAQTYLARLEEDGSLQALASRFFDNRDPVSTGGALVFSRRLETRLPQWQKLLEQSAESVDLPWPLLAAISYQESHWNPKARSHTGVRGLMMLTLTTAREMDVSNRLDPEQSIAGGARYFRSLYDRLPERIEDPDRTWLALAAYNVGMSHLEDARILTQRYGGNPDVWADVKKHLPLLAKRKYYSTVDHGYARGWEPVTYVRNIRRFRDIIAWHHQQKERRLAMAENEAANDSTETPEDDKPRRLTPTSVL